MFSRSPQLLSGHISKMKSLRQFILLPLSSFSLPGCLSLSLCYKPSRSSSSPLLLSLSLSSENTRSAFLASLFHRDVPPVPSSSSSSEDSLLLSHSSLPVSPHRPSALFVAPFCSACTSALSRTSYTLSCCSSVSVAPTLRCRIYSPVLYPPDIHNNLLLRCIGNLLS